MPARFHSTRAGKTIFCDHRWGTIFWEHKLRRKHVGVIINKIIVLQDGNIYIVYVVLWRWRSWFKHCAASRKVAGSIPDVIAIFHWRNPSDSTVATGVDSASDRNEFQEYFLGGKGGRCVGLTTLPPSCADCLEIWDPQSPVWPIMGFAFLCSTVASILCSIQLIPCVVAQSKELEKHGTLLHYVWANKVATKEMPWTYHQSAIWKACRSMWVLAAPHAYHSAVYMVAASQARTITSRQAINYRVEENLLATYSFNLTKNGLAQCPLAQNIMTASFVWLTYAFLLSARTSALFKTIPIKTDDV